ncbi:MAG: N-acetylmuramoyl-L-alanine amidase [Desulfobacterales bacterium]|nr:MAG: N-acetylmuramoyl-L-alanine amidase [Desulfobacterales bacterium]
MMRALWRIPAALVLMSVFFVPGLCNAYTRSELNLFQSRIVDYRRKLNPRFRKVVRQRTDLIIVHTSELGLGATLRVVSQGKPLKRGQSTPGGHANYVIARNGRVYRVLHRKYQADHAGLSMWDGTRNISRVSVGVELVGYHYASLTASQYRSLGMLLDILKRVYKLSDRDILTHSQVAYGPPNPWFKTDHRGRKRCAKNFDRAKAGLGPTWPYDPDVRAGRLAPDPTLASVFYRFKPERASVGEPTMIKPYKYAKRDDSNIISKDNTAWSIAGEDYNDPSTAYILPNGRTLTGSAVEKMIGWNKLPVGTRVLLNQLEEQMTVQAKHPIRLISERMSAWSHAGKNYRSETTIYFLPSGRVSPGSFLKDWDDLPAGTRLIVGYKGPYTITRDRTAYRIARGKYNDKSVVYHIPGGRLVTGDKIQDFSTLPVGVNLYLPVSMIPGDRE